MKAQELRNKFQKMYSSMDYFQFCEYMGLNPKYDQKYWEQFQKLCVAFTYFDNENIQKILDFN